MESSQKPHDGRLRVGVTGHRALRDPEAVRQSVREMLREVRDQRPDAIAVTALAPGADTIFAEVAVELGMPLEVVIPFRGYPVATSSAQRQQFERLLEHAKVSELHLKGPGGEAYMAAGMWVIG